MSLNVGTFDGGAAIFDLVFVLGAARFDDTTLLPLDVFVNPNFFINSILTSNDS